MSKENSNRTEAEVVKPFMASRDREEGEELEAITEDVELVEAIEDLPPIEPEKRVELNHDSDDMRSAIAKRHDENNRNYVTPESPPGDETLADDEELDIITNEYGDEMVEAIVNGISHMVEKSKVDKAGGLKTYQKQAAADERLRQASIRESNIERRERELADRELLLTRPAPPSQGVQANGQDINPNDPPPSGDQDLREIAKQHMSAVLDGEEDEAAQLMSNLIRSAKAKEVNPAALVEQITTELEARSYRKNLVKAFSGLVSAHPELDPNSSEYDPIMFNVVDDHTSEVATEYPDWDPADVMAEAYKRTEKWRGVQSNNSMQSKFEKKRSMNRPNASTGSQATPPPPPEKTGSDYVRELRLSRGQGV